MILCRVYGGKERIYMDDKGIVQLYWDRNESAISESSKKYGAYCTSIAHNILNNAEDEAECINDTWLHAWNAMPPQRPAMLSTFLGKITRNLSFDVYKKLHRKKRGGSSIEETLEELSECVSGQENTEQTWEMEELMREINQFLLHIPEDKRYMFILRYWYVDSISEIASRMRMSENNVSVSLNRIRKKLREHLTERGFDI